MTEDWNKTKDDITSVIVDTGSATVFNTSVYTLAFDGSVSGQTDTPHTETILVKLPNQVEGLRREGLLPDDELLFWARYDSSITIDSTFTYNSKKYVVLSLDESLVAGIVTHFSGRAKRSRERE